MKALDTSIVVDEVEALMMLPSIEWHRKHFGRGLGIEIYAWAPPEAEERFLAAFRESTELTPRK